ESNQKDIIDNYYLTIKALDVERAELKAKIVHDVEVANNKLDDELRKFIQSKDVLIKNIPNEIKDKKINLKNENNKLNNDIKLQRNLAKGEYIKQKNESNRLLYEINITYKQRLLMVKKNKKHEEKKTYRRHNYELKRGLEKKFTTL
ncbi:MAG: hypothetical protein J6X03_03525, partial [Bacilli bacterium]|nr:hypothetical protein [Bacilli bacterium]